MTGQARAACLSGEARHSSERLTRPSPTMRAQRNQPSSPMALRELCDALIRCWSDWEAQGVAPMHARRELEEVTSRLSRDLQVLNGLIARKTDHALDGPKAPDSIRRFMIENLGRGLTLRHLARFLGYSNKYCSDFFRLQMGESFSHCLARLRIEKAKALLLETTMPISQIAEAVGFSDQFAFSHFFKRTLGCAPTQFRHRTPPSRDTDKRSTREHACRTQTVA